MRSLADRTMAAALAAALALGVFAPARGEDAPAAPPASAAQKLKVKSIRLLIGHRVFTDFRDEVEVRMNEEFRVGDSDYSAKAVEFQPDFAMDMKTHKVGSRSNLPNNPAVKIYVKKNGAPDDTSWAFLKMPPHFARHSMLAFKLARIEFENHAPVEAPKDSAAAAATSAGHP